MGERGMARYLKDAGVLAFGSLFVGDTALLFRQHARAGCVTYQPFCAMLDVIITRHATVAHSLLCHSDIEIGRIHPNVNIHSAKLPAQPSVLKQVRRVVNIARQLNIQTITFFNGVLKQDPEHRYAK